MIDSFSNQNKTHS